MILRRGVRGDVAADPSAATLKDKAGIFCSCETPTAGPGFTRTSAGRARQGHGSPVCRFWCRSVYVEVPAVRSRYPGPT